MAKEIVQADLARIRALLDEVLGHSDYSDVQRMGGLTNRTYCVTFADGSRIMVRIPGEGTEELIDRADDYLEREFSPYFEGGLTADMPATLYHFEGTDAAVPFTLAAVAESGVE